MVPDDSIGGWLVSVASAVSVGSISHASASLGQSTASDRHQSAHVVRYEDSVGTALT